MKMITATDEEFTRISRIVYAKFGINLTEKKKTLVNSRLQSLLRKYKFKSFSEYITHVENRKNPEALTELINKISTNHTFFFREIKHFEFLKDVLLPEVKSYHRRKNSSTVRFWCAAASTGEEPYSLMMEILEFFGRDYRNWHAGLLATDISQNALGKAQNGVYTADRIKTIPPYLLHSYFDKIDTDSYRIKDFVKKEVLFKTLNLIDTSFPLRGNFDLISCRNVMIYFDRDTKNRLVQKLYDQLRPGGYLFTGHSESLSGLTHGFSTVQSAIYKKPLHG
ncbi:MAG: CheR family methyltransferase [Fibrobacterota bacterium]